MPRSASASSASASAALGRASIAASAGGGGPVALLAVFAHAIQHFGGAGGVRVDHVVAGVSGANDGGADLCIEGKQTCQGQLARSSKPDSLLSLVFAFS